MSEKKDEAQEVIETQQNAVVIKRFLTGHAKKYCVRQLGRCRARVLRYEIEQRLEFKANALISLATIRNTPVPELPPVVLG